MSRDFRRLCSASTRMGSLEEEKERGKVEEVRGREPDATTGMCDELFRKDWRTIGG